MSHEQIVIIKIVSRHVGGCVYAKSNGVDDDRPMQSGATSHAKWFDMAGEHHSHTHTHTHTHTNSGSQCVR